MCNISKKCIFFSRVDEALQNYICLSTYARLLYLILKNLKFDFNWIWTSKLERPNTHYVYTFVSSSEMGTSVTKNHLFVLICNDILWNNGLEHRFLTGGPYLCPRGSAKITYGKYCTHLYLLQSDSGVHK